MTLTISLPAETEARLRDRAVATGKDVSTIVQEAVEEKLIRNERDPRELSIAIVQSRELLTLRDEDDHLMISLATWERATAFLESCVRGAFNSHGVRIELPHILPGPLGSIDLHWKHPTYEMLINILANPNTHAAYYGDDAKGNSVKGTIAAGDNGGLLLWLMTRN